MTKTRDLMAKNMKGVVATGYRISNPAISKYLSPILLFAHTALLPVTTTLGAGIKTAIDVATRNPLPEEEIARLSVAIDHLSKEELEAISHAVITDFKASSCSSKRLIQTMHELKKQEDMQKKDHLRNAESKFGMQKIQSFIKQIPELQQVTNIPYKLSDNEKKNVSEAASQTMTKISVSTTALMKLSIGRYFLSPDNNGKKLHCLLASKLKSSNYLRNNTELKLLDAKQDNDLEIYVDDDFNNRVEQTLAQLQSAGARWKLGIGNIDKANKIRAAFENFKNSKTAENMYALMLALDEHRVGLSDKKEHAQAYNNVFPSSEKPRSMYSYQ